jgi:hypothetical protein
MMVFGWEERGYVVDSDMAKIWGERSINIWSMVCIRVLARLVCLCC